MGPCSPVGATICGTPHGSRRAHYQVNEKRQPLPASCPTAARSEALYSRTMKLANLARVIALAVGCAAAIGSASSTSNTPPASSTLDSEGGIYGNSPPPPQQMEPSRALGLWKS